MSIKTVIACGLLFLLPASIFIYMKNYSNSSVVIPSRTPSQQCQLVADGFGPNGQVKLRVESVAQGLEVPWAIGFLPSGSMLVTERPGRVRLLRNGSLVEAPVAVIPVGESGEGGLLGLAVDPDFQSNRYFYVYYTAARDGANTAVNRIVRYRLSEDETSATQDRVLVDNIPAAAFHNGGRIRFGPDNLLYVGTGDAREPELVQSSESPAGKILRITRDGQVPADNPIPGNPLWVLGIRNTQGFDWTAAGSLVITDHGPSGEMGRVGGDRVALVQPGDNLGWPINWKCQGGEEFLTPLMAFEAALPPGGATIMRNSSVPEWNGDLIVGVLRGEHLHRFDLNENGTAITSHEVYFMGEYGRLRDVVQTPQGDILVTTSNCDGRGQCPVEKDRILRISSPR